MKCIIFCFQLSPFTDASEFNAVFEMLCPLIQAASSFVQDWRFPWLLTSAHHVSHIEGHHCCELGPSCQAAAVIMPPKWISSILEPYDSLRPTVLGHAFVI